MKRKNFATIGGLLTHLIIILALAGFGLVLGPELSFSQQSRVKPVQTDQFCRILLGQNHKDGPFYNQPDSIVSLEDKGYVVAAVPQILSNSEAETLLTRFGRLPNPENILEISGLRKTIHSLPISGAPDVLTMFKENYQYQELFPAVEWLITAAENLMANSKELILLVPLGIDLFIRSDGVNTPEPRPHFDYPALIAMTTLRGQSVTRGFEKEQLMLRLDQSENSERFQSVFFKDGTTEFVVDQTTGMDFPSGTAVFFIGENYRTLPGKSNIDIFAHMGPQVSKSHGSIGDRIAVGVTFDLIYIGR